MRPHVRKKSALTFKQHVPHREFSKSMQGYVRSLIFMLATKLATSSRNKVIAMKRLELAHRGARLTKNHTVLYVENSLPAILAGLNVVNGVEIDVFYIKGTWWISHDFELSRFDSKETLQTASTDTVLKQENKVSRLITIESLIKALNNQPFKEPKLINIEIKQHFLKLEPTNKFGQRFFFEKILIHKFDMCTSN